MSVILLILKILGIMLLICIGVFILAVLAVLFGSVTYRIKGHLEEEEEQKLQIQLHWMFYLVYFRFRRLNDESQAILYIAGIPKQLYPPKEKKVRRHHSQTDMSQESAEDDEEGDIAEVTEETEPKENESEEPDSDGVFAPENKNNEAASNDAKPHALKRFWTKLKRIFSRIRSFFTGLPQKLKTIYKKFSSWKEIITDESNKASVKLFYSELKYLLSHYKPHRIKADVSYGFSDPSVTGKSLAVISMIPFLHGKKVQIVPDFQTEQSFVKGNLDAKGHIRLFHLIRSGMHIWKDKNSRRLLRKIRQ